MGDNLTVRSPGARRTDASSAEGDEKNAGSAVDKQRDQLAKLREMVQQRHGKTLTDQTLLGIIHRHQEKTVEKAQSAEAKALFEADLDQETVATKPEPAQTQAQKATGAQKLRGSDGLSDQSRQQIASNPKAGPTLPPTTSKAATPEQAQKLVGKMLANVTVDGQPLDPKTYAQTLKAKPPTQPKSLNLAPGGTQTKAAASTQASLASMGSTPSAATLSRAPAQPGLGQKIGGNTTPLGRSTVSGLPGAPGMGNASLRLGGGLGGTTRAAAEAMNAGGGLLSEVEFDGMSFNWDSFFMKFIVETQRDLATWKRAMRQMRSLAAQGAISAAEAQAVFTEITNELEQAGNTFKMAEAGAKMHEAVKDAANKRVGGYQDPERIEQSSKDLRDIASKAKPDSGRTFLTDKELPPTEQARYHEARATLEAQLGNTGFQAYLVQERSQLSPDDTEAAAQLDGEIASRDAQVKEDLARAERDTDLRKSLRGARGSLAGRADALGGEIKGLDERIAKNPPDKADLIKERDGKLAERAAFMGAAIEMDRSLARLSCNNKVHAAVDADIARTKAAPAVDKLTPTSKKEDVTSAHEHARLQELRAAQPAQTTKDATPTTASKSAGPPARVSHPPTEQEMAALEGQFKAGGFVSNINTQSEVGVFGAIVTGVGNYVDPIASAIASSLEEANKSGPFAEAVNRGIQSAVSHAKSQRAQLDGKTRQATKQAQGMINQLAQMIRLTRSV